MEEKKKLIATGIDIEGNEIEFSCEGGNLGCYGGRLISLTIPEGITYVSCEGNQITELILPEGIKYVYCQDNQLTELKLPEGVRVISCNNNQLTGLEKYIGTKLKIELR